MAEQSRKGNTNGYQILLMAHRQFVEQEKPTGEELEEVTAKIKALEILAGSDQRTRYELFNTGAFNDIMRGYAKMALDDLGIDGGTRANILDQIRHLLDRVPAGAAEAYNQDH